ncbi:hypothetical protein M378DRAFT_88397, partial [Amanita muscaria Koide BX008]
PYTVQPFDETEIRSSDRPTQERMRAFNRRLSGIRIEVEHAFGMLKGRFRSLKEMGPHADVQEMYKAIEALLILHNMCIEYGDKPEDIWGFDPTDPFDSEAGFVEPEQDADALIIENGQGIPAQETDAWLKRQGRAKRMIIFDDLFPIAN